MEQLKSYIYLDKGYHKSVSEEIYAIVKKNNGIIASLDEEGAIDYSDGSTLLGRYSRELFNNVDHTFLWGANQYKLVKRNTEPHHQVSITGHPRFELLKPRFHSLYEDQVEQVKDRYNDFILIIFNTYFFPQM